ILAADIRADACRTIDDRVVAPLGRPRRLYLCGVSERGRRPSRQPSSHGNMVLACWGQEKTPCTAAPPPRRGLARCFGDRFCYRREHVAHGWNTARSTVAACAEHR